MITIIAHRGLWQHPKEQNTPTAFQRALDRGWGIETDVNHWHGTLCISHDVPTQPPMPWVELLQQYTKHANQPPLLINIKADGLGQSLLQTLGDFAIDDYRVFDMSVPETVRIAKARALHFLTRISDVEPMPCCTDAAGGLWVDSFDGIMPQPEQWQAHSKTDDWLCFVSPELHGRDHQAYWQTLKQWQRAGLLEGRRAMLCTDHPNQASKYFEGALT